MVKCRGKLKAQDVSSENVCDHHKLVSMRIDNENIVCNMDSCGKKARSSGYCTKHTPEEYHQRADLLPENGFGDESNPLYQAYMQAKSNIQNKERVDKIEQGRRR